MIENGKFANAVKEKRGIPVYRTNPSIPGEHEIKKMRRTKLGDDHRGLVVDNGTGEILGHGGAIAYEWEEVDKEGFVKLYLAGLKQASGLSKAGLAVFEIVYNEMRGKPGEESVLLGVSMSNSKSGRSIVASGSCWRKNSFTVALSPACSLSTSVLCST